MPRQRLESTPVTKDPYELYKQACWIHLQVPIAQYLMSNSSLRADGALKAHMHRELCSFYVATHYNVHPDEVRRDHDAAYKAVHVATQVALTDRLDEAIGFPLHTKADIEELMPKFFDIFHRTAMQSLSNSAAPEASPLCN